MCVFFLNFFSVKDKVLKEMGGVPKKRIKYDSSNPNAISSLVIYV